MTGNAWEFACGWYKSEEIESAIKRRNTDMPEDVRSPAFAAWLTTQYRLAMAKGIDLARVAPRPGPATEVMLAAAGGLADADKMSVGMYLGDGDMERGMAMIDAFLREHGRTP